MSADDRVTLDPTETARRFAADERSICEAVERQIFGQRAVLETTPAISSALVPRASPSIFHTRR